MNKEILNQIPAEEKPAASKLNSTAEMMQVSPTFRWNLEAQLMDAYKTKEQPAQSWYTKLVAPVSWAVLAVLGVFALSWTLRSLVPSLAPASRTTPTPVATFEANVRAGNVCKGPLAVAHDFSVARTNQNKTGFVILDEQQAIGELRSMTWSPDGRQLAIVGNTTGSGNIYLTDSANNSLKPVLSNPELGYLWDAAWSQDGKQLLAWSFQNNTTVYLMNADGTGSLEKKLNLQIFATPQFTPDNQSIIFYGTDSTSSGLFEASLDGAQVKLISALMEDEGGYAWSPDGSQLTYMEMDRTTGEARLTLEAVNRGSKTVIATLPIPKGSGSSIPEVANLSWSRDGKNLVFDFGRGATDHAIYLAHADGTGLVKLLDSAYAPAISSDENCLAYISDKQVFLLDLTSKNATPLLLADLPSGRSIAGFKLDKLQWGSEASLKP
ncbi:MAG: hypothetical protein ABI904_05930 [Chloroflexota bacterium]